MATILLSNLAPISDAEVSFFVKLIREFEKNGHQCVILSTVFHVDLAPWFLPLDWNIRRWGYLYSSSCTDSPLIEPLKWMPRISKLTKQEHACPQDLLRIISSISRNIFSLIKPDLLLAWNKNCPHIGVLADICKDSHIPVHTIERGMFPGTWYFESGGLVAQSVITGKTLRDLFDHSEVSQLRRLGLSYLRTTRFDEFNRYAQTPGSLLALEEKTKKYEYKIAFFPPDDNTLGFIPESHEDKTSSLPGFESSLAAAVLLAENTQAAVLYKPHPSFSKNCMDGFEHPDNFFIVDIDFRLLIRYADAVASTGSGLAFVALAYQKPHINLAFDWLSGKEISYEAQSKPHLQRATTQALAYKGFSTRIDKFRIFVGFLLRDYLVSEPKANPNYLGVADAVTRMLVRQPLPRSKSFEAICNVRRRLLPSIYHQYLASIDSKLASPTRPPFYVASDADELTSFVLEHPNCLLIVDFDHTLFLGNSTELFIAGARPHWLAFMVSGIAETVARTLYQGSVTYSNRRDHLRVLAIIVTMPWSLPSWRVRAQRLGRARMNQQLVSLIENHKGNYLVASLGFSQLINPILRTLRPDMALVASSIWKLGRSVRDSGKDIAVAHYVGEKELASSLVITDSIEDLPLMSKAKYAALVRWGAPEETTPAYIPLRYTTEGKYPNKNILSNQHFGEDFVVIFLAYHWAGTSLLSLPFLFLAFFTIYEIGYYENDFKSAAKEISPTLAPEHKKFSGYPIQFAWPWAIALSAIGLYFSPGDYFYNITLCLILLSTLRFIFFTYNNSSLTKRIWLYPCLQCLKGFFYVPFATLTLPGLCLILAQSMRQITNYTIYRARGNTQVFRRQTHRALVFLFCIFGAVFLYKDPSLLWSTETLLIFFWILYRVYKENRSSILFILSRLHSYAFQNSKYRKDPERLVIFGAGDFGQQAWKRFNKTFKIEAFVDNDPRKHNSKIFDVPVVHPNLIRTKYLGCKVYIAAPIHFHSIYLQLRELGYGDEEILSP